MIKTPPIVERYHSYVIAYDNLLEQDAMHYFMEDRPDPKLTSKIRAFHCAVVLTYAKAIVDHPNLEEYDTDQFIKSLTSGWFG